MCCKNFWKKIIPFIFAMMLGILITNSLLVSENQFNSLEKKVTPPDLIKKKVVSPQRKDEGRGCGECPGFHFPNKNYGSSKSYPNITGNLKFLSKPHPKYTEEAKQNNIQGEVILRITFLANGQIGSIKPVKELPYGLTEQAIEAARKIKFEPALRNGNPISVTKSVQYTFTIY